MPSLPPSKLIVPPSKLIVTIFASQGWVLYEGGNRASVKIDSKNKIPAQGGVLIRGGFL